MISDFNTTLNLQCLLLLFVRRMLSMLVALPSFTHYLASWFMNYLMTYSLYLYDDDDVLYPILSPVNSNIENSL